MVNGDGQIKVMDFGIAKVLGVDGKTRTNLRMGTAWYMAPEQVLNRKVDARTDIYALGVTLYEILSGQVPFRADSEYEILSAHVQRQPELPTEHYPHIPRSCVAAVMRALEKEPEKRFQSTDEFIAALDLTTSGSTATITPAAQSVDAIRPSVPAVPSVVVPAPEKVITPPPVPAVAPPPREKKGSPWLGVTAAIVLVVILGAAGMIMFMREREKHASGGGAGHQASAGSQHTSVTGEQERRMQEEQDQAAEELKEQLAKEQVHASTNSGQQQVAMAHSATPSPKPQNQPPRNPPNSTVPQPPQKNEDEATRLQKLSGTWSGTYTCQQGLTGVTLQIVASSSQNVGALLQFSVPNSPSGAYFMRGVFNPANNAISMSFTKWKYQPAGYAAANITGTVNFASNELRGTVLLPGCAALSMRKQ
jgi:serine/threonine protein kinase